MPQADSGFLVGGVKLLPMLGDITDSGGIAVGAEANANVGAREGTGGA